MKNESALTLLHKVRSHQMMDISETTIVNAFSYVYAVSFDNKSTLVQAMAWCQGIIWGSVDNDF